MHDTADKDELAGEKEPPVVETLVQSPFTPWNASGTDGHPDGGHSRPTAVH